MVAATTKILAPTRFRGELADYELLPARLIGPIAVLLPISELGATIATFNPSTRVGGSIALLLMLCAFTVAIGVNLRRGHSEIRCACFGEASQTLSWVLVLRNLMLIAALILAVALSPQANGFVTLAGAVGAIFCAALGWLLLEAAQIVPTQKEAT